MIRVENLRKSFGGQPVLKGVNLEVNRGEIMIVIGQSGGGKTVLLKHLLGLLRADAGRIVVAGADVTELRGEALDAVRRRYGVVFQGGALFDSMSVFDNVAFPLRERTALGRPRSRSAPTPSSSRSAWPVWAKRTPPRSRAACASASRLPARS